MLGLLLPFNYSSFMVILLVLVWLLKDGFKEKYRNLKQNRKFIFLSGFYFIYVLGLLYSEDFSRGVSILEKNLTILILPFVFASSSSLNLDKDYKLLSIFAFVNLFVGVLLVIFATVQFLNTGSTSWFYYDKLTEILNFHPIYLAMYVLFSIVILIYGYIHRYIQLRPIVFISIIACSVVFLILLSSKTVLAISMIILLYFILTEIKSRKGKLATLGAFLLIFMIAILSFSTTKNRIKEIVNSEWGLISKEHYAYNENFTGITLRIITWKIAIKHLWNDENIMIGVSPGDSQNFVDNVYAKYGMDAAGYTGYNLHNQYVEILIKSGIIGLLVFLSWIFILFKEAVNRKKLYFFFLLIFFTSALTESNLEVHRGIVFFALFNSLFFFSERDEVKE